MYPQDVGYILLKMNIIPGSSVIEAGTGSGCFTQVLATYVGDTGHVFSYESREEMQKLAQQNLNRLGLSKRVTFMNRSFEECFDQNKVNAVFLDLPNPYDHINQVRSSLISGRFFGTLLPTTNQVIKTLTALRRYDFQNIDVCEILIRFYQAEEMKFRPVDRMVAHTGYLIFARPVIEVKGV